MNNQNQNQTQNPVSKIQKQQILFKSKWLGMKHIYYSKNNQLLPPYQATFRTTRKTQNGNIDGVGIYPIIKYKNQPSQLLMIANFRPSTGKFVIQFPAGLMDSENLQQNAKRQVLQQTGYHVQKFIETPTPITFCDPWKSNQCGRGLVALIDGDDQSNKKQQDLQGGQNIRVHKFPISKDLIKQIGKFAIQNDYGVEKKLWTVASTFLLMQLLKTKQI